MHDPLRHSALCAHVLLHFILVLFGRHWLVGLANISMTVLLGLGLIRGAECWQFLRLPPQASLQLRRTVLITALFKGAFYLVLGESLPSLPSFLWIAGIQLPSPAETAGLLAQSAYSIWHLTEISRWVLLALSGAATLSLVCRLSQLLLARRSVEIYVKIGAVLNSRRVTILLEHAACRMGLPNGIRLPRIIETNLLPGNFQTPLLVGPWRPMLILPVRLVKALSNAELEMVLRHELAHFIRRDHWWRWLLLWVSDIAQVTLLAHPLKQAIIEIEERLCDRQAVQSPQEGLSLASALKAAEAIGKSGAVPVISPCGPDFQVLPSSPVIPLLLGSYATSKHPEKILRGRLEGLLIWSNELSDTCTKRKSNRAKSSGTGQNWTAVSTCVFWLVKRFCYCLLGLLLILVLYAKFYVALNLR